MNVLIKWTSDFERVDLVEGGSKGKWGHADVLEVRIPFKDGVDVYPVEHPLL